jgi:hypothetical protein
MSYGNEKENELDARIAQLENMRRDIRSREKSVQARSQYLSGPSQFAYSGLKNLHGEMKANLAPHMLPANVGALNEVAWQFFFQAQVDIGTNPTISTSLIKKSYFQVDQEAAFILMSVSRAHLVDGNGSATEMAPLKVEFIDRQSSRRFNSGAVPLQQIGNNSNPSIFPTPMLLMPNAFLDIEVSGMSATPFAYTGSGLVQFSFFGYRTRVENAQKVLSTIFG